MDLVTYLLIVNIISALVFAYDKFASRSLPRNRVAEKTIFLLALAGGALAIYALMGIIRHKTRHRSFTVGIPLIILIQVALYYFYFR